MGELGATGQIHFEGGESLAAERHDALFLPLAEHPQLGLAARNLSQIERRELAHAQTRAIQELERQRIAQVAYLAAARLRERRAHDLRCGLRRQEARKLAAHLGAGQGGARVLAQLAGPEQKLTKRTNAGDFTGDGRRSHGLADFAQPGTQHEFVER